MFVHDPKALIWPLVLIIARRSTDLGILKWLLFRINHYHIYSNPIRDDSKYRGRKKATTSLTMTMTSFPENGASRSSWILRKINRSHTKIAWNQFPQFQATLHLCLIQNKIKFTNQTGDSRGIFKALYWIIAKRDFGRRVKREDLFYPKDQGRRPADWRRQDLPRPWAPLLSGLFISIGQHVWKKLTQGRLREKKIVPGYPEFGFFLNRTGRAMVYSCSWPVYQIYAGINVNTINLIIIQEW